MKYLGESKENKQDPKQNKIKQPTSIFWNNSEFFTVLLGIEVKITIIPFTQEVNYSIIYINLQYYYVFKGVITLYNIW